MASKYVLPLNTSNVQVNPSTDESVQLLRRIVKLLESQATVDSYNRQRVSIESVSGSIVSGTVASGAIASGAIASGAIASGAIASGAIASGAIASGAIASGAIVDWVYGQRWAIVDAAREAYNSGIRSKLTFS